MPETPPVTPTPPNDSLDIQNNKWIASLSYIWILFLIPLFLKKDSPFCQEHAKQGLVLFLTSLVLPFLWLGAYIITFFLSIASTIIQSAFASPTSLHSFASSFLFSASLFLLCLCILSIFHVVAFIKCLMGQFWEIPLIGKHRKAF